MASKIYNGIEDNEKIEYDLWENLNKRKAPANEGVRNERTINKNRFKEETRRESCRESDLESVGYDVAEMPRPKDFQNISLNFYKDSFHENEENYCPIDIGTSDYENFNPFKKEDFYTKPVDFEPKRYIEHGNALECIGEPSANAIELVVDLLIDAVGFVIDKIFF